DRAALGLLLVSGDFLASRFIIEVELPALLERGVRLAPVLVHDCLWEHEPLLTSVQWAHDPGRDGPLDLDADREGERDRRLVQICRKVVALLPARAGYAGQFPWERPESPWEALPRIRWWRRQALLAHDQQAAGRGRETAGELLDGDAEPARVGPVEAGPVAGRLDGVPPLPPGYLAREELAGLVAALSEPGTGAVGLTGDTQALGLHGQGGIGKTVLAC